MQQHVKIQLRDALGQGFALFRIGALAFLVAQRLDGPRPFQAVELPQRLYDAQREGLVIIPPQVTVEIVEPLHFGPHKHLRAAPPDVLAQAQG